MAANLLGLAIIAGLLLPALAAAAWAISLERRPRRSPAPPDTEPDFTVAGIRSRIHQEYAARQLADAGTVVLPTLPIPAQTRRKPALGRLPLRVVGTLPPPRPATAGASRFAFAAPDSALMQRILDGLRQLD